MKLDACATIIDEEQFLRVNRLRAQGPPDSAVTRAAIDLLNKFNYLKSKQCNEKSEKPSSKIEALKLSLQKQSKLKTDQSQMKL